MTDETRTIDLDQLATVSGGTAAETEELKQAILANPALAKIWQRKSDRYGFDDSRICHLVLLEAFGSLYADCSVEEANNYSVIADGEFKYKLNQSEMLILVNNYREF